MDGVDERAAAKLNLFLHVRARRDDGLHEIDSLVAFADIGDELRLERARAFSLAISGPFAGALAGQPDNLVKQAAKALAHGVSGVNDAVAVSLQKHIPVAAGLGGGSADAAATLRAMARLQDVKVPGNALRQIAARLGADVPCCLSQRAQWLSGTGRECEPAPQLPALFAVLVNAAVRMPTGEIYKRLGLAPGETFGDGSIVHRPERFGSPREFVEFLKIQRNDLEAPAAALSWEIGDTLEALFAQPGCALARMTGSGATCFGLFFDAPGAEAAARAIAAKLPGWWVRWCALG